MTPVHILHLEVQWFLLLLAATFAYRMLTRRIPLNGLLSNTADGQQVSPERVQLLIEGGEDVAGKKRLRR